MPVPEEFGSIIILTEDLTVTAVEPTGFGTLTLLNEDLTVQLVDIEDHPALSFPELVTKIIETTSTSGDAPASITVGPAGAPGLTGAPGPQGIPGPGADKTFVFTQSLSSQVWVVGHNLGKFPSASVVDSGGTTVFGTVTQIDLNTLTVSFSYPFSGKVYCN